MRKILSRREAKCPVCGGPCKIAIPDRVLRDKFLRGNTRGCQRQLAQEIRLATARIRATWSEEDYRNRGGICGPPLEAVSRVSLSDISSQDPDYEEDA